jgi:hypothetical protein
MLFAAAGYAGPVTLPFGAWQTEPFTLMNSGDFFPTTYIAAGSGTVEISGYYVTGDYYDVYIAGKLVLTTKQVLPTDVDYGDQAPSRYADPGSGYASGLFSSGQFTVNAGDWITISDLYPPGGIGEVGLQLLVPEPASFWLWGAGAMGVLLGLRRRRTRHR